MATMYATVKAQYDDYVNKLANKKFRLTELSGNTLLREIALLALYSLSAEENNSTNMTAVLALLESLSGETITPPSLVISGLETEAAGGEDVAVTAGSQSITFPLTLTSDSYSLLLRCVTSDGNFNSHKVTNKTASGFTIDVAENGYIDYRAVIV